MNEMLEKLKKMLEDQSKNLVDQVNEKLNSEKEKNDSEIKALQDQLKTVNDSLKSIQENEAQAKTFGMPGLAEDLETMKKQKRQAWSWGTYFLAMYLTQANGRGNTPHVNSIDHAWDVAKRITGMDNDFCREVCKEYTKKRAEITAKSYAILGDAAYKGYESDDGSSGGFLVPPEISSEIIDLAIAQMPIMNMPGIMRLNNLHGDLFVPSIESRNTGYHVGETTAPTESTGSFGGYTLRPKKVGAFTKQSNRLLYQTRGASDTLIKRLLSEGVSLEWHRGLLNGKGSENEGAGILSAASQMRTQYGNTTVNTLGSGSARFKIDHAQQMQQALDYYDELRDTNTYGYLTHPQVMWGLLRQKIQQYSGQALEDGMPVDAINILLTKAKLNELIGPMYKTTQMPVSDDLTKVIYGDWSLFWTATFRDPIFRVSDQAADGSGGSAFLQDQLYLVMFVEYDCRCMRPGAFAINETCSVDESSWTS